MQEERDWKQLAPSRWRKLHQKVSRLVAHSNARKLSDTAIFATCSTVVSSLTAKRLELDDVPTCY